MLEMKTKLCVLEDFPSVESSLIALNISKSQIKKTKFPKKFLEKKIGCKNELEIPLNLLNQGIINPVYSGPKIEVLFEDNEIICINKPPKIHSHSIYYDKQNNVLSFLREYLYLKKTNFCFDRKYEGGLLYRLDFETSGVLFFSKTKEKYLEIRKNFQKLAKSKEYICIVQGKFDKPGIHKHHLSAFGPRKSKVRVEENGELGQAVMETSVLDYNPSLNLTLLKIKLFSGIRHQIRAQLSFLGYPILGDKLYGGSPEERCFLHAYKYSILIGEKNYQIESKKGFLFDRFFDLNSIF
jgi:23S rRNA pseudouridine1911/1915/1917 synthase